MDNFHLYQHHFINTKLYEILMFLDNRVPAGVQFTIAGGAIHRAINKIPGGDIDVWLESDTNKMVESISSYYVGRKTCYGPFHAVLDYKIKEADVQVILLSNISAAEHMRTFDISILYSSIRRLDYNKFYVYIPYIEEILTKKMDYVLEDNKLSVPRYLKLGHMGYEPSERLVQKMREVIREKKKRRTSA